MNAEGINPARHEIERQLERMLAHPLFEARQKQAEVFEYLVKSALDGKKVNEWTIFEKSFKDYRSDEDTSHVRTTVSYIRNLLKKYYAEDGEDDPVIITLPAPERTLLPNGKYKIVKLPPGEAYTPEFRYNPRSEIAKEFAIANYLLRKGPSQIYASLFRFAAITGHEPGHPDALLGFAEAVGSQLLLGIYPQDQHGKLIAGAFSLLADLDPDTWRIHMVSGLLYTCAGNLDAARGEFEIALNLDRQSTISRGWYVYFLFADGEQEEALRLVALVADEHATNPQAHAMHGVYLSNAGHYEEAERAFAQALRSTAIAGPHITA
ncbi:MAG: tetratricopeptide repeat protein [Bryobacteraceae bacterium]